MEEKNAPEEKSFNEGELKDIMAEIETLEQEMKSEPVEVVEEVAESDPVMEALDEPNTSPESDNQLMENLSEMTIAPEAISKDISEKVFKIERPAAKEKSLTKMDFSVEGNMSLNLNLNVSGQSISFYINRDEFVVEMGNGARFTLPIDGGVKKAS